MREPPATAPRWLTGIACALALAPGVIAGAPDPCTGAAGAPAARDAATAVWTGRELIVWGGRTAAGAVNSGARYDPVKNAWTATTLTGAPAPRAAHTAVWTGREMIVWGGYDGGRYFDTGGRYDPATDKWTGVSASGAPAARMQHSAVWTGTEMIIWGGADKSADSGGGGRYSPRADAWTPLAAAHAPVARRNHTAVWTGTAMIVWGGYSGGLSPPWRSTTYNTGARYDPAGNSWTPMTAAAAPPVLNTHSAVWTGREMIVWGNVRKGNALSSLGGRYDPAADSWAAVATNQAPSGRGTQSAVWTGTEMIVWGGWGYKDGKVIDHDTGGRYDPAANAWQPTPVDGAPAARRLHLAVWTGTEMIVWGGNDAARDLDTGGRFDPARNGWNPVPAKCPGAA